MKLIEASFENYSRDSFTLTWVAEDERVPGGVAWGNIDVRKKDNKVTIDTERMGKKFALEVFAKLLEQAEYAGSDKDLEDYLKTEVEP